jgi:hypothetical protein
VRLDQLVTTDDARRLALLRGDRAHDAVRTLPVDGSWTPRWSPSGSGRVVPLAAADDLAAVSQVYLDLVVITTRKAAR